MCVGDGSDCIIGRLGELLQAETGPGHESSGLLGLRCRCGGVEDDRS